MTIKIKDSKQLEKDIFMAGFTLSEFSRTIKKCRGFMHISLKNRTIGPDSAKKVCKVLGKSFETHFELVKESNNKNT